MLNSLLSYMNQTLPYWGILVFLPLLPALWQALRREGSLPRNFMLFSLSGLLVSSLWRPIALYFAGGLVLVCWLVYLIAERPRWRWSRMAIVAGLYMAWGAVSLLWSAAPATGVHMLIDRLPILILLVMPASIALTEEDLFCVFRPFCRAAGLFIGLTLLVFVVNCLTLDMLPWEWPLLRKSRIEDHTVAQWTFRFLGGQDGYTHPSYNTLPLFLAAVAAMWQSKRHQFPRLIAALILPGALVAGLLSQSRMVLIYTAILTVTGCIYVARERKLQRLLIATVGTLSISFTLGLLPRLVAMSEDPTRDRLQQYTWQYIQAKPIFGSGIGALNPVEMSRTVGLKQWPHVGRIAPDIRVSDWKSKTNMLPHNQFWAEWAQTGVAGLLLTALLYGVVIACAARKKSYWACCFYTVFLIFSVLEPPLFIPKGMYLFSLVTMLIGAFQAPRISTASIPEEQ